MAIRYEDLLSRFEFSPERDPFRSVNATEERNFLPEYFVAPPFFESVWGNTKSPKSCMVFAPTGSGKTAQIIMMQERASLDDKSPVLTLLYDDFERQGITSLESASLKNHLHALTRIGVIALLSAVAQYDYGSVSISSSEREQIQYLASNYLGSASEQDLVASLKSIRSPLQKLSGGLENIATSVPLLAQAMKLIHMEPTALTMLGLKAAADAFRTKRSKDEESKTKHENAEWYDFERCMKLLSRYYNSVYILIDRVDETSFTTRNAANAYSLVSSLLTSLPLLNPSQPIWCFKFFLWDAVLSYHTTSGRTDRVETHKLEWSSEQLSSMLDKRVSYYSNHKWNFFLEVLEPHDIENTKINISELLMLFSGGSPRDSIRILLRIFNSYLDLLNKNATNIENVRAQIPLPAIWGGLAIFARERFNELVPDSEMRRQMESIHNVCLTSITLTTRVQKISANAANSKISTWKASGALVQIGDVMMNRTGKPNRLYAFSDPRVALCISGLGVEQFVRSKINRCSHCSAIQMRDWDSGNQHGQCTSCQSVLASTTEPEWEPNARLLRDARREITQALNDKSYVELIADDLGFSTDDLIEQNYASVEMMWKWLLNLCIAEGPLSVQSFVNEVLERITPEFRVTNIQRLGEEAISKVEI